MTDGNAAEIVPGRAAPRYRFGDFVLDVADRQLWRDGARVELTGRYFDALALLVREHGQLVRKGQFFDEVWGDVVVGDAALTQCVKEIRRHLGDDAARPRFIQTVPRFGYRFVGPVSAEPPEHTPARLPVGADAPGVPPGAAREVAREAVPVAWRGAGAVAVAGTLGGAAAGVLGGLLYGFAFASAAADPHPGTASTVLVLVGLNVLVGSAGGFGVSAGWAAAGLARRLRPAWRIVGASLGGLCVGALARLLGVDAFALLVGRAPAEITGGAEGAVLGAALALGLLAGGGPAAARRWRPVVGAGAACAAAGALIALAGGRLMGGSLEQLTRLFAGSRLPVDGLGSVFGDAHFGATTQAALSSLEGLLFGTCVAVALVLVWGGPPCPRPADVPRTGFEPV